MLARVLVCQWLISYKGGLLTLLFLGRFYFFLRDTEALAIVEMELHLSVDMSYYFRSLGTCQHS